MPKLELSFEIARPLEEDARQVLVWRNDPVTLASFYHQTPKVWEAFWPEFRDGYFQDPNLPPLFILHKNERVAFLRFQTVADPEKKNRACCDISINVSPKHRGRGLGVSTLKIASEFLKSRGIFVILSEIRAENKASIATFRKAGFQLLDKTQKHIEDTGETCSIERYLQNITERGRALLLDFDGTLADSLRLMRDLYFEFMKDHGIEGSETEFMELNGPPLNRVVDILKEKHHLKASSGELLLKYMNKIQKAYPLVTPNPGAGDILEEAFDKGWRCAIVTSSNEAFVRQWLLKNGFSKMIVDVIGKESVRIGKPDPEPYLIALGRLGCEAQHSLAVEDSLMGWTSASRAGLPTFTYHPSPDLKKVIAKEFILHHFTDLKKHIHA